MTSTEPSHNNRSFLLGVAALATAAWIVAVSPAVAAEENPDQALARLDARLAAHPDDLAALAERAEARGATGQWMGAFLDRQEILRRRPEDTPENAGVARRAAYDLAAAGARQ